MLEYFEKKKAEEKETGDDSPFQGLDDAYGLTDFPKGEK